jgi:D-alanyl-D-alanine carboxypeptidase (penicillin-binding protein 5/6)
MTEVNPQTRAMIESRTMRAAATALALLVLAGAGFFGAYTLAGAWYSPEVATQEAAAVASSSMPNPFASVSLIAKSAYVVDLTTGKVLYEQNEDAQLPLASLTKVALMLSVSQVLSPDAVITIPPHKTPDGTSVQIPAGSEWRAQDLIDVTLVESSNEGAELLAQAADSAIQAKYPEANASNPTLWRMNDLAGQLGLTNTYFLNVSGLDLSTTQSGAYGSAHDIATLMGFAATTSLPTFAATTHTTVTRTTIEGKAITAINTDAALDSIPGILMGKTGYTDLAGGNLAVVFDAGNGHPVVAVVLGSTEDGRFSDMKQLVPAAQTAVAEGE